MDEVVAPEPEEFGRWARAALPPLEDYLRACARGEGPVIRVKPLRELLRELDAERWMREGGMDEAAFARWLRLYLDRVTRLHHPACMGHQVAVPLPPAAVADLVAGVTNNGCAIREMAPPGVALERGLLRWMAEKIGWNTAGGEGGGALVSGGSLANLTALLAARARAAPEAWERGAPRDLAVLASSASHYSVTRALGVLGLGAEALVPVATDAQLRLRAEDLPAALRRAVAAGRRPIALVASAVNTASGLHDPLETAGAFCRAHGLWFHVDAAHGASALLSPTLRARLRGIEHADSVVWDAHKMLHTSSLCAAVLVRDPAHLEAAFRADASYLGDPATAETEDSDPWTRTLECTRPVLALKLFLNLAAYGEAGLGARVEQLYATARRFHRLLVELPGVECLAEPESNILCFRVGAARTDQAALRRRILAEGSAYLTQASIHGEVWLRLTIMNPASGEKELRALVERLLALAAAESRHA